MKTSLRFAVLAAVGVLVAVVGSSFIFYRLYKNEAEKRALMSTVQVRTAVRSWMEVQTDLYADRLAKNLELVASVAEGAQTVPSMHSFLAVGLLDMANFQVENFIAQDAGWGPDWAQQELRAHQTEISKLAENEYLWLRGTSPSGATLLALLYRANIYKKNQVHNRIAYGFLPNTILSDINRVSVNIATNTFLVDAAGEAFSYQDKQYIGAQLTSHPIVAAIHKKSSWPASGIYNVPGAEPVVGGYEKVSRTNLYVVTAQKSSGYMANFFSYLLQVMFVAVALALFMGAAMYYWKMSDQVRMQYLEKTLAKLQDKPEAMLAMEKVYNAGKNDRAYTFAHHLLAILRSPLLNALGQLQIAEGLHSSKTSEEPLRKAMSHLRNLNYFADSLAKGTMAPVLNPGAFGLPMFMSQVLDIHRQELQKQNILVEENFNTESMVKTDYETFKNILKSTISFITTHIGDSKRANRMIVTSQKLGGLVRLTLEGVGVWYSDIEKAELSSDYSVLSLNSDMLGLDFVYARSQMTAMGGDFEIQLPDANRIVFVLTLPVAQDIATSIDQDRSEASFMMEV